MNPTPAFEELEQDAALVEHVVETRREVVAYTYEDYAKLSRARDGYFPRNDPLLDYKDADPQFR